MSSNTPNLDDCPVLVAIDFGTTYSGCAYAYAPQDKTPKLISEWPGQIPYYAKTPTTSVYKKNKSRCELFAWGWNAKLKNGPPTPDEFMLATFKLRLDETADLPPWDHSTTVLDAISDYLRAMHDYAAGEIEQQLGNRHTRQKFRYLLTVPAMWSDKAKHIMREAAIRAGLVKRNDHPDRLTLVSEPEAAALYCELSCKEYDLKINDRFLICDAGGGTVDLIVYDITESYGSRQLSEVTKGHGASCGSTLIDWNFCNLLVKTFSKQNVNIPEDFAYQLTINFAFENKPQFNGQDDLYLKLPRHSCFDAIKDPDAIGIDESTICFTAAELKKSVFDPVVNQVLDLIQGQLDSAENCSAIFLVGGFGSSNYLLECVRRKFGAKVKTISAPNRPEIAVVFGAVYAGLYPKKVAIRATRRCYGVGVLSNFEFGIDPPELMRKRVEGVKCANRFSTFVTKGQLVNVDECISHDYTFVYQGRHSGTDAAFRIFAIDGAPPRYVTDLHEAAYLDIPNICAFSDPPGHEVPIELKFYFGLSEILVEAIVQGRKLTTRLTFDSESPDNTEQNPGTQLAFRKRRL